MQGSLALLDLPEEVICAFLRYLDATTLYFLSRTCTRLDEIIKDYSVLWRRIDARRSPNTIEKISYCLDRCYDDTHTLLLRGDQEKKPMLAEFLPRLNTFSKLTILACENQALEGSKYNVMAFPPQLHELSLKKTLVTNSLEFFRNSGDYFQNLRVLILDECDWVTSMAFVPISKYRSLEIFSIYKCRSLDNSIAYLSLSGLGFKALKILDARLSPLGNTLVHSIYRTQSLLALYLQNEDITYKLDYFRRQLDILNGSPTRDFFVEDNEFDLKGPLNEENSVNTGDYGNLDDHALVGYFTMGSDPKNTKMPVSILYLDPYNPCTCGFEENERRHEYSSSPKDDDDDDDDDHHSLSRKISQLSDTIFQNGRNNRSQPRRRNPSNAHVFFNWSNEPPPNGHMICMHLGNRGNGRQPEEAPPPPENNERSIINVYIDPQLDDTPSSDEDIPDEPPSKRVRVEDPLAGPSGLNANQSSDSSDEWDDETCNGANRPPTPHPENPPNFRNDASYRIYFRDSPIVQIENIKDIHKDVKVPLRRLSLRGHKKITDFALNFINDLELDLLDVTYTSVTSEAVEKYLESHPLCRVLHERFCTCLPNLHF